MKLIVMVFLTMSVISVGYWSYTFHSHDRTGDIDYRTGNSLSDAQTLNKDDQKSSDTPNDLADEFDVSPEFTILYPAEAGYAGQSEWFGMLDDEVPAETESIQMNDPMLTHEDPALRLNAVESLTEYRYEEINNLLLEALYDPAPQVRATVAESLGMQQDEDLLIYLEPVLYDTDRNVRIAAIWAIADLESEQGIYALAPLLSDSHTDIRFNTIAAMGEIGGAACVHYLENHRYDSDERIRRSVAAILYELEADY
ncbi:MAG: HEAT repeat domain-containing protein [Candidatus Thiodiazotropha taylori]|uniref:HEAT repeat domain-containing protein n=1 Tax=Candidatus Thiodiazotropha taylori TaxID=2792791 RepID=A0A9E4N861_9GAMM|nr:HEAT repeat domain-containing protein [Candidatus Thiodiazotropha taylori]MCW4259364.1 HEAT repeat domain-containing protein [Candidatus Thiodiazotropha taylori]